MRISPLAASFQVTGLDPATLDLSHAVRLVVDTHPGFPCRVSLADAPLGETVYAFSYTFNDVDSPFRASGPIYIREAARPAALPPNELPALLRTRTLSIRGYDADGMMVTAELAPGVEVAAVVERMLEVEAVQYLHVHNALRGCFLCEARRT